jgi:hypothetical protein
MERINEMKNIKFIFKKWRDRGAVDKANIVACTIVKFNIKLGEHTMESSQ